MNPNFNSSEISRNASFANDTWDYDEEVYIFHRLEVKIPFLIIYTIVFLLAFFGNLLVVAVMILHRRMRSHTNFFLTNLAVADLCVAVFCIYQNFALYIVKSWYLGEFLCRMYHFVNTLSYTASVIILVVVGAERYLAIVEPLKTKSILTRRNMIITMVVVWALSALYSCPRLLYFKVAQYPVKDGVETMCILRRDLFDTRSWDVVSLIFLYLAPLTFLLFLYIKVAKILWKDSLNFVDGGTEDNMPQDALLPSCTISGDSNDIPSIVIQEPEPCSVKSVISPCASIDSKCYTIDMQSSVSSAERLDSPPLSPNTIQPINDRKPYTRHLPYSKRPTYLSKTSPMVLEARRKVVHMLIMVVMCFAICSLPFHTRKMLQYFLPTFNHTSTASYLMTPITFLLMYAHSAVNPLLYMYMCRKFRNSTKDFFTCRNLYFGRKEVLKELQLQVQQDDSFRKCACAK